MLYAMLRVYHGYTLLWNPAHDKLFEKNFFLHFISLLNTKMVQIAQKRLQPIYPTKLIPWLVVAWLC